MRAEAAASPGTAKEIIRMEIGMPLTTGRGITDSVRIIPLAVPEDIATSAGVTGGILTDAIDREAEVMTSLYLLLYSPITIWL